MRLRLDAIDSFQTATGGGLAEGYGMTESSPVTLATPLNANARPGTIGLPFPSTHVKIVDESRQDRVLPIGAAGGIVGFGPPPFQGYWNNPGGAGPPPPHARPYTRANGGEPAPRFLSATGPP